MKKVLFRSFISILLVISILLMAFPVGTLLASAADTYTATFYVDQGSVVIDDSTASGRGESGNKISISNSAGSKYLITQHQNKENSLQTANNISISGTQDVTLKNVNVRGNIGENLNNYALIINKDSNVKITVDTYAKLTGGSTGDLIDQYSGYAGLQVNESSSVEIYGFHGDSNSDYLYATGAYSSSAGIGGGYGSGPVKSISNYQPNTGNITIYSGNIRAEVTDVDDVPGGAGIGSGVAVGTTVSKGFKSINILGGVVTAYGGNRSAGIGGGCQTSGNGTITIENANVSAFAGRGIKVAEPPDIGGTGSGGGVNIKSGTVIVRKRDRNGKFNQNGIIGMVNGNNYISGGTILYVYCFNGADPTVSATDSTQVYPVIITLPEYMSDTPLKDLSVSQNSQLYPYGGDKIFANSHNQLMLYLPKGDTSVNFQYNGNFYNFKGNVTGTSALKVDQASLTIYGLQPAYTYGASVPVPNVTGGSTNGELTCAFSGRDGTSYNSTDTPPTTVGKYTYTAVMTGNDTYYDQSASVDFEIIPKSMTFSVDAIADQTYTGSGITPDITVKDAGKTLVKDTDYTVSYSNNKNAGTADVAVTGTGNYSGSSATAVFKISPKSMTFSVDSIADQTYTGSEITPDITVKDGGKTLVKDTDYNVAYKSNVSAGTASVTVTGTGNYLGSKGNANFIIQKKDVTVGLTASKNGAFAGSTVTLSAKILGSFNLPRGTVQFKYDSQVIATKNIINNNGNYEATADWANIPSGSHTLTATYVPQTNDDYYAASIGSISNYSVSKQDQKEFKFTENSIFKTYGDPNFTISTENGLSSSKIVYTVSSGNDVVSIVENHVVIKKAGTASITAQKLSDSKYNEASATVTINIGKAQTAIKTLPKASDITVVGKISSVGLTGGIGSTDGTFVWTNPDTVVSAAGEYDVTFTPSDTGNYLPCVSKVQVTVIPLLTDSLSNIVLDLSGVVLPAGVTSVYLGSTPLPKSTDSGSSYSVVIKLIGNNKSLGNLNGLTVYDLKLLDQNGRAVEKLIGKIKVKIPIPAGMSGNLHIFWYNPNDGNLTDMNATQENNYLVFETSHFSNYAIAEFKSPTSSETTSNSSTPNPVTGSDSVPYLPLAILGIGSAEGFVIVKKRMKFVKKV